eukprot:TRINITY_DN3770_c0_g1_i1.p1 TRINITY_DN3770_c0_g1~~TRINITY_DN3770_c0_g1_i1.p1  ORF type:complete len:162 (+),score=39.17 TRINITY_DN3770_c0_g1_i1:211-696(+)
MVVVQRKVVVSGARAKVFDFVADFANIERWDPGVVSSKRADSQAGESVGLGAMYDLVTVFKGTKSPMTYEVKEWSEGERVRIDGDGVGATSVDIITFRDGPEADTTEVDYYADIQLKGWKVLLTWLVSSDIQSLGDDAMRGMTERCAKEFGGGDGDDVAKL